MKTKPTKAKVDYKNQSCGDCAHWYVNGKKCLGSGELSGDPACKNFKPKK